MVSEESSLEGRLQDGVSLPLVRKQNVKQSLRSLLSKNTGS